MRVFKQRMEAPNGTEKYWISEKAGGYSPCIIRDKTTYSTLPNCVGYAWGRFYELTGDRPKLSTANAENWYSFTQDGYKRSQTAIPGAVACWEGKGSLAGHVAIVEKVGVNGDIAVSASNYSGAVWYKASYKRPYFIGSNYTFQGFILPDHYAITNDPISKNPVYLIMGYASPGDLKTLEKLCADLGVSYMEENGYLKTAIPVSSGDQVSFLNKCEELGIICKEWEFAETGSTTVSFSLPKELAKQIDKYLVLFQCKRSAFIVQALRFMIKNLEQYGGLDDGN